MHIGAPPMLKISSGRAKATELASDFVRVCVPASVPDVDNLTRTLAMSASANKWEFTSLQKWIIQLGQLLLD